MIAVLILGIGSFSVAQDIEIVSSLTVETVQGLDGFWYLECIGDCQVFYELGDISDLYQSFNTDIAAINYFGQMRANYEGTIFVPLPPAQGQ